MEFGVASTLGQALPFSLGKQKLTFDIGAITKVIHTNSNLVSMVCRQYVPIKVYNSG
jgi:hypothetical protein